MSRIFIRHADKGKITDDDPLIPGQEAKIITRGHLLSTIYPKPDVILVSPYLRTRETAQLLNLGFNESCPMIIEPLLSEYIKPDRVHHIRNDTLINDPILWDTFESVNNRIRQVYDKYKYYNGNIWFVCHGVFFWHLLLLFGQQPIKVPTLSALAITNTELILHPDSETIARYSL